MEGEPAGSRRHAPRWPLARWSLAIALAAGVLLGTLTVVATFAASGPPCPARWGSAPQPRESLSYDDELVQVPIDTLDGSSGGPMTNDTFDGVEFQLWPEVWARTSTWNLYGLDIAIMERSGIELRSVVFSNTTPELAPSNWTAPDGIASVTWLSNVSNSISALLRVAQPGPDYHLASVAISTGQPLTYCFDNVRFELSIPTVGGPAGEGLYATISVANGTTYQLEAWDGLEAECEVSFPGMLSAASCLESVSLDRAAGVLWTSYQSALLIVSD